MTILQENIDAVIDQLTYIRDVACANSDSQLVELKQNIQQFKTAMEADIRYAHAMPDPQPEFVMFIKGMQHVSGLFDDIVGDVK